MTKIHPHIEKFKGIAKNPEICDEMNCENKVFDECKCREHWELANTERQLKEH